MRADISFLSKKELPPESYLLLEWQARTPLVVCVQTTTQPAGKQPPNPNRPLATEGFC